MSIIHNTLSQLTQLFLANTCPLCERSTGEVLCQACCHQMVSCHTAKTKLSPRQFPQSNNNTLTVLTWGKYHGLLKQALTLLKYGHQAELGIWLGVQLGNYWRTCQTLSTWQHAVVVPIPLHRERQLQRGYNQAELIAKGFCRATGLSLAPHGLIRTKRTLAMHSLGVQERKANLHGAFQIGKNLPSTSRPILLIDDIYTTGSTALAATVVLRTAGYTDIGITAVAQSFFV